MKPGDKVTIVACQKGYAVGYRMDGQKEQVEVYADLADLCVAIKGHLQDTIKEEPQ